MAASTTADPGFPGGNDFTPSNASATNAGNNAAVPQHLLDHANNDRIYNGGTVDMGCFESSN